MRKQVKLGERALDRLIMILCALPILWVGEAYSAQLSSDYTHKDKNGIPYPQFIGDNPCNKKGYESPACKQYMNYLSYQQKKANNCIVRTIEDKDGLVRQEKVCLEKRY
ncbi:hypothetical protein QTP81_04230 [Alteromonas sp. ASW11-36]|uniref:Uncharacterized protein n=1 Tax=Alteromonas arenosi TaxID=3055817 RepID=A0ABT7SUD6_9ALTE|nr:hypothetical protein [Alteromonas sp. ASW11-36]MDM7859807.1 hypothetical protein [Alteromonas sp. ASW11-36]